MRIVTNSLVNKCGFVSLIMSSLMFFSCNSKNLSKHKVLIVTGGHDFEREEFFNIFNDIPDIEYKEIEQPKANQMYASQSLKEFDVFIFYDMFQDINEDQKEAFLNILRNGKGIMFLHHSLVSYQDWNEYENIIGGRYNLDSIYADNELVTPSTYKHDVKIPVKIVDKNNPITKGLDDFLILDEVYGNFKVLPTVQPLITTNHPESGKVIGWTNNYSNSRIVYIQLGHDHHAYKNLNYRRLIKQSINWVRSK